MREKCLIALAAQRYSTAPQFWYVRDPPPDMVVGRPRYLTRGDVVALERAGYEYRGEQGSVAVVDEEVVTAMRDWDGAGVFNRTPVLSYDSLR